jgi:hypothetical protein
LYRLNNAALKRVSIFGLTKILNLISMEANPTLRVVHRLIIQKPELDPAFEDTELNVISMYKPQDNNEYYPDFGI